MRGAWAGKARFVIAAGVIAALGTGFVPSAQADSDPTYACVLTGVFIDTPTTSPKFANWKMRLAGSCVEQLGPAVWAVTATGRMPVTKMGTSAFLRPNCTGANNRGGLLIDPGIRSQVVDITLRRAGQVRKLQRFVTFYLRVGGTMLTTVSTVVVDPVPDERAGKHRGDGVTILNSIQCITVPSATPGEMIVRMQ